MKIKGIVTLVFRDVDTGEITKTVTEENNVTNWWIENVIITNSISSTYDYGKFGPNIFISDYVMSSTDPNMHRIPNVVGVGFVDAGVTSPTLVYSTETTNAYGQYQNRFSPPASLLDIRIVGLFKGTIIPTDKTINYCSAYLKLTTPITQDTTETLDIFYRVEFPYDYYQSPSPANRDSSGVSSAQTDIMAYRMISLYNTGEYFTQVVSNWNGNIDYTRLSVTPSSASTHDAAVQFGSTLTLSPNAPTQKLSVTTAIDVSKSVGNIIGFLSFGDGIAASKNPWSRGVSALGTEVVQNIFGHNATAVSPFYNAAELNSGDGTIVINGDSWTNPDFPKLYRLNITGTGGVGVGTYKFQVRNHFGFILNTYLSASRSVASMMFENRGMHDGFDFTRGDITGTNVENRDRPTIIHYTPAGDNTSLLCVRKDQVYLFNIQTEEGVLFNSTNYPTFAPTNITQVTFESDGTIYVGCRATGIYKISTPLGTPTVTLIDNSTTGLTGLSVSQCYGVAYGNGRLWAAFDGGLFYSVDSGVSWTQVTFTNATITADWTLVKFIQADPTHADHRLCIVYESGGTTTLELTMLWWDATTTTDVLGKQFIAFTRVGKSSQHTRWLPEEPWTYFNLVLPSPTGNKWGSISTTAGTTDFSSGYPTYYTFGTTTSLQNAITALRAYHTIFRWELDAVGDYNIATISAFDASTGYYILYKDDNTYTFNQIYNATVAAGDNAMHYGTVCMLENLVVLCWKPDVVTQKYSLFVGGDVDDPADGQLDHLLYDYYGWGGSPEGWVLDAVGSKTIHAAAEVLNDGVTIAFDDAGATQTFVNTDFYTVGVLQGIWLDGATQIDHYTGLYFKNIVDSQTTLEVGTLAAGTRSPEIFQYLPTEMTWQDVSLISDLTNYFLTSGTPTLYDSGARSIEKIAGAGITNKSSNDKIHGSFRYGLATTMGDSTKKITVGLSPASVLGTGISPNSAHFGIQCHGNALGTSGTLVDVNIIEQGVVVSASVEVAETTTPSGLDFEIEILVDGTVNYYYWKSYDATDSLETLIKHTRELMYTSLTTAPIVDYYVDVAMNGSSVGLYYQGASAAGTAIRPIVHDQYPVATNRGLVHRVPDDLYITIGDFGTSKGRYLPNFFAVDYTQNMTILIAGVPATTVLYDDVDTVLAAGEVSVFAREGFIRYSGSDVGKTISATYQCLTTS